jgi:alpha-tubulin suppressor-like RCC1 family protein
VFSMALTEDGEVLVWGDDTWGQIKNIPKYKDFVEIDAGPYYCLAKRKDGTVIAWGSTNLVHTPKKRGMYIIVGILIAIMIYNIMK